jgi:hypothetical protein
LHHPNEAQAAILGGHGLDDVRISRDFGQIGDGIEPVEVRANAGDGEGDVQPLIRNSMTTSPPLSSGDESPR